MIEHEHNHETCRQLLSTLGDYVDGSLSEDLCTELEKHMKGCNRCRVVVDTLKKTVELYHGAAEEEKMPVEVRDRLFLKLNLEDYKK